MVTRHIKTGTELKMLMTLLGYNTKQAAQATGVTEQTWKRYCSGGKGYENGPPLAAVAKLLSHHVDNCKVKA